MNFTVINPTGRHCFIGHQNHPGIDVSPVSKTAEPQKFDVPEELIAYFTRAVNTVIPEAVVLAGDEQPEQGQAGEPTPLDQPDAEALAADKAAESKAKAEAKKRAKATTSQQPE
ncbi:hypothetical protein [Aeromonas dhakensis]|uniref:hypothetical protein n=1 Tax=Aeromonas dhakensis TaxID=196024 RepID=UPI00244CCEA0|nr:hypothetical protein [Aeromonas dhakensis]MDH0348177.1 hypothetical protein [Aeromonas dhakensis]